MTSRNSDGAIRVVAHSVKRLKARTRLRPMIALFRAPLISLGSDSLASKILRGISRPVFRKLRLNGITSHRS